MNVLTLLIFDVIILRFDTFCGFALIFMLIICLRNSPIDTSSTLNLLQVKQDQVKQEQEDNDVVIEEVPVLPTMVSVESGEPVRPRIPHSPGSDEMLDPVETEGQVLLLIVDFFVPF